jgi:hypothetical protein
VVVARREDRRTKSLSWLEFKGGATAVGLIRAGMYAFGGLG